MVLETKGSYAGDWVDATDRYLGIKFIIDDQVHYGWIGFSRTRVVPHQGFQARFSGWAYETEPNTPIRAGQRTGTADSPMALDSEDATSLELRAAGHVAQPALRQRGH